MRTKVFSTIADVDPGEWNALVGRNHLIGTHEWLLAVEKSRINDCRYFYLVLYDDKGIAAHTSLYFISTELDLFATGILKLGIRMVRRLWKDFLILRTIECGTPVALGNTISFRAGVDKLKALTLLVEESEKVARQCGVGVLLFRDFYIQDLPFFEHLQAKGYLRIRNLPSTRIDVRWKTFDEYLASFRSKYKRKIVVQNERFYGCGGAIERITEFSSYAPVLRDLWQNSYNVAKEYKREVLTEEFFRNVSERLPFRASVIFAKINEKPVGYMLLLDNGDELANLFCGLDYEYSRKYCVYFALFYKVVEIGIAEGRHSVDLGITTIEPKLDLGAVVVPLYMYMKHLNPLLNKVVPKMFSKMTPQPAIQHRNVFKA